ncbi:peptidoglycan DD-metalloendopeptidase family protein [Aquimarina sp. 2201CG5-10]|uniref:peptidoglycan DD-metalloendopeptidase family protein n=1 Tax=Aquimarina callyspongiae TaxID=3098150 RepID=UPI002AB5CE0C|nr:peptidoglycan DD-metalloendopeptidase family protein [Aquimarina sp. 2201CG5-10]MDY8134098.1 peptidoglycan DD-metalloendopeptidase family protein [Aquimarina sp. 2201CG5-10]
MSKLFMTNTDFSDFIVGLTEGFVPIVSPKFSNKDYVIIDLSISNPDLKDMDTSSSQVFEDYIKGYLSQKNALVAFGGYKEIRSMYSRSPYFNKQDPETERNIHLGLDIWCDAETEILSPLDAKIHSFKNNTNYGDYGPTIILEHTINSITFYTLYGHLSVESIQNITKGQDIKAGEVIATLGDASVNGDYAPHLHFQIIGDMQGMIGDYPGVSNKKDLVYYQMNCPDPNLLLKITT